jgi:hypothetical protein
MSSVEQENLAAGLHLARSATASPMMIRDNHHRRRDLERVANLAEGGPPPSPDALVVVKMESSMNRRNGSRDRMPKPLQLQLQPLHDPSAGEITSPEQSSIASSTRFHWPSRRRGPASIASSTASVSTTNRSTRAGTSKTAKDDYIHSLDAAQYHNRRQRSRRGSRDRGDAVQARDRDTSRTRKSASREQSEERGRASARQFSKPKRSPTSPVPMSPEDLMNLSTPRTEKLANEDSAPPSTVRRSSTTRKKSSSRASSRRRSPDSRPRPPAIDTRGRSKAREGSMVRSPSSPLPMSANAAMYQGSDDEEDLRSAIEAKENFRSIHNRSVSRNRGVKEPMSPESARGTRSRSRRRPSKDTTEDAFQLQPVVLPYRAASTEHAGDLRRMKEERQRKKEQAARELEERRKSLAQRPQAPIIPHPSEISPALTRTMSGEDPNGNHGMALESSPRTRADQPRSMFAQSGSRVPIGLPATPKAMRLIVDSNDGKTIPSVPPIPATFAQRHSPVTSPKYSPKESPKHSPKHSPTKDQQTLALLPSTVYQPPTRPPIPRCMSAPIPDEPSQRSNQRGPPPVSLSRGHTARKLSVGDVRTNEGFAGYAEQRRGSHDSQMQMAPPPPPPVMLKELQHLATPPPPPPAPLPMSRRSEVTTVSSGTIEIVMDDEETAGITVPPTEVTVPVLAPPAPPSAKGHSRGRSTTDNSLAGRISKATERLRSASRSRKEAAVMRTKSPIEVAPYESVPPPVTYNRGAVRSPVTNVAPQGYSTGLHRSEMI